MLLVSLAEKILLKKELSTPNAVPGPSQKFFHFVQPVGFSSWGKCSPALFSCFPDFLACFSDCSCLSCSPWAPPLLPCGHSSATWLWLTSMLNFLALLKTNFCSFFFPSSSSWQLMRSPSCLSGIFHSNSNTIVLKLPSESLTKFFGSQDWEPKKRKPGFFGNAHTKS